MKLSTLFTGTAVLSIFFLCSCRAGDEQMIIPTDDGITAQATSLTGGPVTPPKDPPPTPPKDVPKDYDDWRMGNKK